MTADAWEKAFTHVIVRNLAAVRDDVGLTIDQLAKRCDEVVGEAGRFKPNTLQGLFAGKRKNVTYAELVVFAQALGLPVAALLVPVLTSEPVPMPGGSELTPTEWWAELALSTTRSITGGGGMKSGRRAQWASVVVRDAARDIEDLRTALDLYRDREGLAEEDPTFRVDILVERVRRDVVRAQASLRLLETYSIDINPNDPVIEWVQGVDAVNLTSADIAAAADWTAGWRARGHR